MKTIKMLFLILVGGLLSVSAYAISNALYPDVLEIEIGDIRDREARYGIWYRTNEPHNNTLKKPFILVTGFDPSSIMRIGINDREDDQDDSKMVYIYNIANVPGKHDMLDKLRKQGYDIIAFRCVNSKASIVDNAQTLVKFLREEVIAKTNNPIIIAGASMGGIVVRYALTQMEHEGTPHNVSLFISIDSPQSGANIPLGFQHLLDYLCKDVKAVGYILEGLEWCTTLDLAKKIITTPSEMVENTVVPMLEEIRDGMLSCPAAREMLLYHFSGTNNGKANPAPLRHTFLDSLSAIGNFPKKCRTFALSQGSGVGTDQGFGAGETLIQKKPGTMLTAGIATAGAAVTTAELISAGLVIPWGTGALLGSTGAANEGLCITWNFSMQSTANGTSQTLTYEHIGSEVCVPVLVPKPSIWFPIWFAMEDRCVSMGTFYDRTVTVNNTLPLDNAPGSTKALHNMKDYINLNLFKTLGKQFTLSDFFGDISFESHPDCFIPSYSSLGLNVHPHTHLKNYLKETRNVTTITDNLYQNRSDVSPFDFLYIENKNLDHIYNEKKEGVFTLQMVEAMVNLLPISVFKTSTPTVYKSETETLTIRAMGGAYSTQTSELQVSAGDVHGWKTIAENIRPANQSMDMSFTYNTLVAKAGVPFGDWMGKELKFRVVKTLPLAL